MKGVFFSSKLSGLCEIRDLDIPTPGKDEILVKNVAVASNPKDWKIPEWMNFEAVEGNDIAGYVEAVGSDVTDFKKGDKVAAFTKMMTDTKYGCYQEYSVSPAHTAWHVADSTSFEEAATLPLAVMTAAIGLYVRLGLTPPPTSGERGSAPGIVLINGAASSVGAFAIQLAKRSGYSVVGIAGQSGDYARSLGADEVVDYRSPDTGKQVLSAIEKLGGKSKLVGTYDAVSTEKTVELLAYDVLQPEGGKIATVLPAHENGDGLTVKNVVVDRTMVGTAHGEDGQFAKQWYRQIGKWLDDGSFKANQVKLMPNGLDSVKEGVHLLKDGKVNAVKLVYRIADSTCLKQ